MEMNVENMSQPTAFRINAPRVVHQTIDGETIIIDFDSGTYYSIDKAGAIIWEHIDQGAAVTEIVQALAQRYDGDHLDIENAVMHILAELQHESLISPINLRDSSGGIHLTADSTNQPAATRPPFETPVLLKYTDMQDLLLLDPIHEVDEQGWPVKKGGDAG